MKITPAKTGRLLPPLSIKWRQSFPDLLDFSRFEVQGRLTKYLHAYSLQKKSHVSINASQTAAILLPLCTLVKDNSSRAEPAILFTVRSMALKNHKGEVSFPGGLVDPQDSDENNDFDMIEQRAVLRETTEEIPSLKREQIKILGNLPTVSDRTQKIRVHPFIGFIGKFEESAISHELQGNPSEVDYIFCMTINELLDTNNQGVQIIDKCRFPYWKGPIRDVDGIDNDFIQNNCILENNQYHYRIWGLTAFVLLDFLQNVIIPQMKDSNL